MCRSRAVGRLLGMNRFLRIALALAAAALLPPRTVAAQAPVHVAPNAPKDRPRGAAMPCQWHAAVRATAPYVARARATYPAARARYQAGLPPGHTFFVTTRLADSRGRLEQVFVAVDSIVGDRIHGRLWSDIHLVDGYRREQPLVVAEAELVDWMIARPDGTEEGNVVGVFLDTYRMPATCQDSAHAG